MVKKGFCFLILFFLLSWPIFKVDAFILPSNFVVKKITENNGKAGYLIEQTLNLRFPNGTISLQEIVSLDSENLITIQTKSQSDSKLKIDFIIKYQNGKRDNGLSVKSQSKEFFEPIIYSRNPDFLTKKIEAVFQMPLIEIPNRLSRFDGIVAFAFGKPTPVESKLELPGFWIEQDTFLIRKIRFSSEASLEQSDFMTGPKGLTISKNKLLKWDQSEATIQISKVHEKTKSTLQIKHLQIPTQTKFQIESTENSELAKAVKDFYERFR